MWKQLLVLSACCTTISAGLLFSAEPGKTLPELLNQRPQPWERRSKPILSARTTRQNWCKVVMYSPHVIYHDGKYRMWYLGTSTTSRSNDIVMGYAESSDGIEWQEYNRNPILTGADIPWGRIVQTPYILFDREENIYKMWFVSGEGVLRDKQGQVLSNDQRLGYATSKDGLKWNVHPREVYWSGRSPAVIKVSPNQYRLWMNSKVSKQSSWDSLYQSIYEFQSPDGLHWTRSKQPVIQPNGRANSVVYPFVLKPQDTYYMWYGCHVAGGQFELFSATSADGVKWKTNHQQAAFPAAPGKQRFDSRYTSTPCLLLEKHRLLMYYSARDWNREYIGADGKKRSDGSSPYSHIGVATLKHVN